MVARGIVVAQVVNTDLSIEANRSTRNERFAVLYACAIDCMPGGEIIGAVEHHVGCSNRIGKGLLAIAVVGSVSFGLAFAALRGRVTRA